MKIFQSIRSISYNHTQLLASHPNSALQPFVARPLWLPNNQPLLNLHVIETDQLTNFSNLFSRTKILQIIEIKNSGDPDDVRLRMKPLEASETRVIVLFAHENAAMVIFQIAAELGLTGADHMWICTQKVVGDLAAKISPPSTSYPIGMLGEKLQIASHAYLDNSSSSLEKKMLCIRATFCGLLIAASLLNVEMTEIIAFTDTNLSVRLKVLV